MTPKEFQSTPNNCCNYILDKDLSDGENETPRIAETIVFTNTRKQLGISGAWTKLVQITSGAVNKLTFSQKKYLYTELLNKSTPVTETEIIDLVQSVKTRVIRSTPDLSKNIGKQTSKRHTAHSFKSKERRV